jgi:hypothetical protein
MNDNIPCERKGQQNYYKHTTSRDMVKRLKSPPPSEKHPGDTGGKQGLSEIRPAEPSRGEDHQWRQANSRPRLDELLGAICSNLMNLT